MKPTATTLLLSASLVANAALLAFVATHSSSDPANSPLSHGSSSATSSSSSSSNSATPLSAALRAALASGDLAALKAAGLPADLARDLALGRALAKFQQKVQAARAATSGTGDARWWRTRNATRTREEELLAQRELSDALLSAFGDDLGLGGTDSAQLAFLSPEKRTALRRITQDYAEMMAKFGTGGVQLASDKEKLRLLRAERDRDIAALLTPAEFADYELRTSPSAATLRSRYGDAIESEDDFRRLFALQKAFDEKFPASALTGRVSPDAFRVRSEAQQQLQGDIRAALGDDKYAALRRAADPELRTLDSLATRVGLPADTTARVATARDTYAAESQRINADSALSPSDRKTQLQDLGARAKTELSTTLGSEVAEAFAPRASWVGLLQNGLAFSTTPVANSPGSLSLGDGAPSVYPVLPAGATSGAPGSRQVVNFVNATSDTVAPTSGGGTLFFNGAGAGDPSAPRTTQVISVSSSSSTTTTPAEPTTTVTPAPKP